MIKSTYHSEVIVKNLKIIEDFDLLTKSGRYQARKYGFNVPKQKTGTKAPEFWSLIQKKSNVECWPWLGRLNKDGYGFFVCNGKTKMAHRFAYEEIKAQKINNLIAMHVCDTPKCCNPFHIVLGTHADNQADKVAKNRQAKGEQTGSSVLTEKKVIEAREKYKAGGIIYKELAKEYGVCKDTMQKAVRGINWRHI